MPFPLQSPPPPPRKRSYVRKVSRGNQVTLPPHFMQNNHLHVGDAVEMIEENGRLIVQPLGSQKTVLIQRVKDLFQLADKKHPPLEEDLFLEEIEDEKEAARHENRS